MPATSRSVRVALHSPIEGTSASTMYDSAVLNGSSSSEPRSLQPIAKGSVEVEVRDPLANTTPRTAAANEMPNRETIPREIIFASGAPVQRHIAVDARPRSQVVAEWQGQVSFIEADYFVAELTGTIGVGVAGSLEEAQIPIEEVRLEDRTLVREGAFFRLCVNWEQVNGSRRRVTDLVFRRMPAYRRDELDTAKATAAELFHALRVE